MMYRISFPRSNKPKSKIPDEEKLAAFAKHLLHGEDLAKVTEELYRRHDCKPPKHAAQAYSAFLNKIERLVKEGDEATIKLVKKLKLPLETVDAEPAGEGAAVTAKNQQEPNDDDQAAGAWSTVSANE
ncbi:MAG: hypothetical protein K8I27_12750 [Planctomycetes bacterium]|nr:hypothetical protein [Planctomycetota bacterium]